MSYSHLEVPLINIYKFVKSPINLSVCLFSHVLRETTLSKYEQLKTSYKTQVMMRGVRWESLETFCTLTIKPSVSICPIWIQLVNIALYVPCMFQVVAD